MVFKKKIQLLKLLSLTFILNGCIGQEVAKPCLPQPCTKQECLYPTIPTFKAPPSRPISVISEDREAGTCVMYIVDVLEISDNNTILRDRLWKSTAIAIEINKEYNK